MKLIFATNNSDKVKEIKGVLQNSIALLSLSDIHCNEELPETQKTIEGNAIQKAMYVWENYGVNCFADDTGLEVDVLKGSPGVYSARYAGEQKNANDNMALLLANMNTETNRIGRFKTVIALIIDGETHAFEGVTEGVILTEKRGKEGFGYDPIFVPNGSDKTFAQMTASEKNQMSHRGKAVKKMVTYLNKTY